MTSRFVPRLLVAVVVLAGLGAVVGSQLAPEVPLASVLFYAVVAAIALFGAAMAALVGWRVFRQLVQRQDGP